MPDSDVWLRRNTPAADAGKRLSDVELANIEQYLRFVTDGGMDHDGPELMDLLKGTHRATKSLLSHIAAITANRGRVSEERARETLGSPDIYGYLYPNGFWHYDNGGQEINGAKPIKYTGLYREERTLAAIQQAVSECSGCGAEEMREAAAIEAESYEYPQYTSSSEHLIMGRVSADIAKQIRALPLPPSPVESRDAQKPVCGTYHSRAVGVACSNCGHPKEQHVPIISTSTRGLT